MDGVPLVNQIFQLYVEAAGHRHAFKVHLVPGEVIFDCFVRCQRPYFIPGGESTSISRLMLSYNLTDEIRGLAKNGLPILGTCAGMILLAQEISNLDVEPLGIMDIRVKRNAFGRQKDSFETELSIPVLGEKTFPGVFIRAPAIEWTNSKVEILARLDEGNGVAAREGKLVASAFHPELTGDLRFHQYFLDIVAGK